jgi:bromodomain adjacent to zinc finger domain protein 1A
MLISVSSRDRLTFSKSLLRKFLRDSVDRESTVASPWIVKPALARQHGLDTVMPEETKKGIEDCRKGESEKRKKVLPDFLAIRHQYSRNPQAWEDKDGPPSKKQKKTSEVKGKNMVYNAIFFRFKMTPCCRSGFGARY